MADISTQKFTNIGGDNLIVLPDTTGANNGDVLTYNTTNGIVWKAPDGGTELTAGTDLTINEGIISVNTTSTAAGNYSFVAGEDCYASDYGDTFACGWKTSAMGFASHTEGQNTIAQDICDHVEGMGGISNFGGCNHIEGFQYIDYINKNTTTSDISTNKIIFNNPTNWSVPGISFTESKYSLSDFISNFKDFFKVSLDYTNSSDYHKTINKNFYKPDLYNIIEVVLTNENTIEVTIDRNLPANLPVNNEIYLIGPVAFDCVYNSGNGFSPGTRIETITIPNLNDQSKKGLNIENVRTDNTFLYINCNYTTIDGKNYLFDRISSFSKIEYNDSGYIFTLKNSIIFPDDINPAGGSFNIYSINSLQYGCNHIEGLGNAIIGAGVSHIEGFKNVIKGSCSHAEGEGTSALGIISHTEGIQTYTETNSSGSHAEGSQTFAIGNVSHAEGYMTSAVGICSHAEGQQTSAIGNGSHAEGQQTSASSDFSHSEGQQTFAIGIGSHSEGQQTFAIGIGSHAEGQQTFASGDCSHAEGQYTSAIGKFSHSEGLQTSASGDFSHAEGQQTFVSSNFSHSEGLQTSAVGSWSHAEGSYSKAYNWAHSEGNSTLAFGNYSHSEGYNTSAIDSYAHSEGNNTLAKRYCSHAEGDGTSAMDQYTHTEGHNTIAQGGHSHAEGDGTSAYYPYSHSEGNMTFASAYWSHTEGSQTYSVGSCSHAEGSSTSSFGVCSHTEGLGTLAYDDYMHVCGQYNATDRNALFVIGNGTSANHSDAMVVSANGVVSAYDYYNAAGDKLSDLTEIISLLHNKPTTGTHVIKCIDGVLTWVTES